VSKAYDFTNTGAGKYIYAANTVFHYVDESNHAVALEATSVSHTLTLGGILSVVVTHSSPRLRKRFGFKGCSAEQQTRITAAAGIAQTYAAGALAYVVVSCRVPR
jgi:peptidyl-Lys metalloendopeptidase